MERFVNKMAIAPTASISVICGGVSPGIDPMTANVYVQKTLSGSFTVRNEILRKVLKKYDMDNKETWSSIATNEGSVQHLDFMSQDDKDTFKTAMEIDQRWVIEHAGDRARFICQGQSVNVWLAATTHKKDLHALHMLAWKKGVKGLYYCRSASIRRADKVSHKVEVVDPQNPKTYDECLACQ